jgi:hypothetical protein
VGAITMYGLSQLVIPNVRFLVIQTALRDYTKNPPPPHSVIFPQVEVLHISSVHSHISCIVAPKLKTMCLQIQVLKKSDANVILQDVFDGHPQMLKPDDLSVSALAHDKYFIAMLKKLKDIKSLTLILQDQPKKALFDALKKPTFVPALTRFTLDLHSTTERNLERRQKYVRERMEEVRAAPVRKGLTWLSAKWAGSEEVFVKCEKCSAKITEVSS